VHGDIDIIPAHTSSRWEIMDANDTALILSLPAALLNVVVEEYEFDPRRVEFRNRRVGAADSTFDVSWAEWLDRTLPRSRGVRRIEGAKLFFPEEMPDIIAEEALTLWGLSAAHHA
jgi:hypothetical protein